MGIGLLHQSLGEPVKALNHYKKALEIAMYTPEVSDAEVAAIFTGAGDVRYIRQNQKPCGGKLLALAYGEGQGLPFLRYANDEAQAVAKLYGANARIGDAATTSAFRASAGDYDILHLVSHYQPNTITPIFSSLILAPGEEANGSLELHDVYGMELKKADLVVLSVCQSNSGAHSRGDDIICTDWAARNNIRPQIESCR